MDKAVIGDSVCLLVNPAARGGLVKQQRTRAIDALRDVGPLEVVESQAPGDETRLAIAASRADARALVVLGGDGAVSHAARGLVSDHSQTPLAVFAAGTGNDFVKSLGTPSHDYSAMAALIAKGHSRAIDVGVIDDIPFVNAAGFGFDVDVLQRIEDARGRTLLRGTAQYVATALRQLFRYKGFEASGVPTDAGARSDTTRWMMLVLANGQWFGGAFRIAPQARLDSGVIECIGIHDVTPLARAALFVRALRGAHMSHPDVSVSRGTQFTLHFGAPPTMQVDGELHQSRGTSVKIGVQPGALRVIAAASKI